MPITTPKFLLKAPSETSQFRNLGKELREFALSIEEILSRFNYSGKDPNLVLTRVAALERAATRHFRTRGTTTTQISSTAYQLLSSTAYWNDPSETSADVSWSSGPRAVTSGIYSVVASIVASGSVGMVLGLTKVTTTPALNDFFTIQTAAPQQGLCAGTISAEVYLAAGESVRVYGLSSATPLLSLRPGNGSISMRKVK